MDVIALANNISRAVATDASLASWCNTTYGREHRVFKRIDRRNPPGQNDCPFVVIRPIGKSSGERRERKSHSVKVDVCVFDASNDPDDALYGVDSYQAESDLELFRQKVLTSVRAADRGQCEIDEVDVVYDSIEAYPFVHADMVLDFGEAWMTGVDPLE